MSIGLTAALMFLGVIGGLALGLPLAFCLAGIAVLFSILLWGPGSLIIFQSQMIGYTETIILIAVPLFILMANILERSGVADALYDTAYKWMGNLPGGLAMGTVIICTIFAAMAGISGAATVTMGIIALPSMLKRNYNKGIAMGCIQAGGALGVLIPPSILMIIYAVFAGESVGKMFLGGFMPGFLLSGLFIIYIGIRCFFNHDLGPPVPAEERASFKERIVSLRAVLLPLMVVGFVLGSIFSGIATPTEASAIGVLGALLSAAVYRNLTWTTLKEASYRSLRLSVMVIWIIIGAFAFNAVFNGLGAPKLIEQIIISLEVSRWFIIIGMQIIFFILGMLMDPGGIIILCTPIFVPIIRALGFDSLWFGILFVVNMEMAFLTPPFGWNLFYMKSIAPEGTTMVEIYKAIVPFVALQALGLVLVMVFPLIATWLPNLLIK